VTDSEQHWMNVWRELALCLLREGYIGVDCLLEWRKKNKLPMQVVFDVVKAMDLEKFFHDGKPYLRLGGKVIPILPSDVRDRVTYRQAGGAA
jgi:hypothetical protein